MENKGIHLPTPGLPLNDETTRSIQSRSQCQRSQDCPAGAHCIRDPRLPHQLHCICGVNRCDALHSRQGSGASPVSDHDTSCTTEADCKPDSHCVGGNCFCLSEGINCQNAKSHPGIKGEATAPGVTTPLTTTSTSGTLKPEIDTSCTTEADCKPDSHCVGGNCFCLSEGIHCQNAKSQPAIKGENNALEAPTLRCDPPCPEDALCHSDICLCHNNGRRPINGSCFEFYRAISTPPLTPMKLKPELVKITRRIIE